MADFGAGTVTLIDDGQQMWQDTIVGSFDRYFGSIDDDQVLGSDDDESFQLRGGSNYVDGGDGFDDAHFVSSSYGFVSADLETGFATGTFRGEAFE